MKLKAIYEKALKGNLSLPTIFVLALLLNSGSQFVCGQQANDAPVIKSERNENYRIGPGDVIDVIVYKNEPLSSSGIRVNNQGTIQLKSLDGEVQAACLTERELADLVKEKYKKYLLNPYVNVAVKEFNANPVSFIGAVQQPGNFQLQRPMRLLELLSLVKGPSGTAGDTVQIIRNPNIARCEQRTLLVPTDSGDDLLTFPLAKTLQGVEEANPFVEPGDIVRLLEADQVQAYINGSVSKPGIVNLKDPVTLTQAIAMAGGVVPGSNIEKVKISRQVPGTLERTETYANLKEINKRTQSDILLQPNDIVEVPGPKKSIWKGALRILVPAITRYPVPF